MEEEDYIHVPYWKGVDEYRDSVDPTSLSAIFAAVFLCAKILLYYHLQCTVILNGITQDNNRVLEEEINETVMFHRMERSIEESVSNFQSMIEAEKHNVGLQQKRPPEENENPSIM